MILDSTLIESAKARANLSSGALAELLGVAEKTIRRSLQGESLPPSMRLLVQLIAVRPSIVPILERLRTGLPIECEKHESDRTVIRIEAGRSGIQQHEITRCRGCGCEMSRPVSNRKA